MALGTDLGDKDLYLRVTNTRNKHMEQQHCVVLKLGQGRSAYRLLVQVTGGAHGMVAALVDTGKRAPLYVMVTVRRAAHVLPLKPLGLPQRTAHSSAAKEARVAVEAGQ